VVSELRTQVSARFAFTCVQFACVKDGSEYQLNDITEWYKLSSLEEQDEVFDVCKGILEDGVLH
jgi:hypothetical protein